MFRGPVTGRSFPWEYRRGEEVVEVKANGRLALNDLATKLTACAAGNGIAQTIELGVGSLLASGELQQALSDWAEERLPLHAYYPSRHLPPAKVRTFLDFVVASATGETRLAHPAGTGEHVGRRLEGGDND
jgi:DNA-binding transcriptional LysR family regulator